MTYRNKAYIAFDGDNDMPSYRIMTAWANNSNFDFELHNAHDLNEATDSSQEESIKKQLRKRFANSKLLILLIGKHTKNLTKFVKWEIETAIRLELPIIAVNLNGSRNPDSLEPASLKNQLAIFVSFNEKIIKYAMEYWPNEDTAHRKNDELANYYYVDSVYKKLKL